MSFLASSSHTSGGRHRLELGLAALVSVLASACFNDPKIAPTQTYHCKDDKSCPWGSVCGADGICCESADGKTCKVQPPSGGLDATAIDSNGNEVGYEAGGAPGLDGSSDTGIDLTLGGPEAGTGGTGVIDAPGTDTVDAPLIGTGGIPGSGGAPGSGGVSGAGGLAASGGVVSSGGVVGTGGITGTGGATTCQPKSRDCTSSLDNDCNGTPDNQESTYCTCPVSQSRACQEHAGYDGVGICKAGSQICAASSDKTTSSWGTCSGSVGPGTRNCTSTVDNDCNGTPDSQETTYCQCSAGTTQSCLPAGMCTAGSHTCAAGSDNTTSGWGTCTGYAGPITQYRDADGDSYGDPAQSAQVCLQTSGYVNNADDCDDTNANYKPGTSICSTVMQSSSCISSGGGTPVLQACNQGCINGACRRDGTIGVPGYISCTSSFTPRCLTSDGCEFVDGSGTCGVTNSGYTLYCDGPNDCPGQKCWFFSGRGGAGSLCASSQPSNLYYQVCDPLASDCVAPLTCTAYGAPPIYLCQ